MSYSSGELGVCRAIYILGDILTLHWRATYIGSHTWKQLNVNCGGYIRQWRL